MSAFAVIYDRSGSPLEPGLLERVMGRLSHRGPDGQDSFVSGPLAMGHWHFWTTPEEVGEKQPVELAALPFKLVLDGRLDNRSELFEKLDIGSDEGIHISDAVLVLQAYVAWGEKCLEHFIGEFALVLWDGINQQLLFARDALGERTLFYSWRGSRLVVASEPWSVVAASDQSPELNENILPYYFSWRSPENGQTFFKNVVEVLPAHGLLVTVSRTRVWRYWEPDLTQKLRGHTDQECADNFRVLLEESVRCRMRSPTSVGVQLSGGLDSGSVACLAARIQAPKPLTTISYVFDELTECDERAYIETIKEKWGIRSIQIISDDFWPFKNFQNWLPSPNQPHGMPLFLLVEQVYERAEKEGLRVLLTGSTGDHLFSPSVNWFTDLLLEGRFRDAIHELFSQIFENGWRRTLAAGFLQRMVRNLLNTMPCGRYLHRSWIMPVWLTPLACESLRKKENHPISISEEYSGLLGLKIARDYTHAASFASHYNIEPRHPYRDRRLVEFVLNLPAHQLYKHGVYKYILRNAMRGILPERIRTRSGKTSANQLFRRGGERERTMLQASIQNLEADWFKFISSKQLIIYWNEISKSNNFNHEHMVLWLCVAIEAWHQAFIQNK